jgi:hypothetical protein
MLLKPSQSLKAIEQSRATIKNTIERVKNVYVAIKEYGLTAKDYIDYYNSWHIQSWHKKVPDNFEVSYGHISYWEGEGASETLAKCEKEIKLWNALNKQGLKQKPKEETMASVRKSFISCSSGLIDVTNYFAMDLDKELAACNKELNKFKRVCEALIKYGVSDGDYIKLYLDLERHSTYHLSAYISTGKNSLNEALDIVSIIEASYGDYKPYIKKWFFRIPTPMDENLKELLNGVLVRYTQILN